MPRKHRIAVVIAAAVACSVLSVSPAQAAHTYSITARTAQAFIAAGPGNLFPGGVDDSVVVLSTRGTGVNKLPFALKVYGVSYTRVVVSSNGNLQFTSGAGSAAYFNDCLPSGSFNYPVIAPFWDDIVLAPQNTTVPGEGLFVKTTGVAPHRQFIINWRGHHFGDNTPIRAGVIFTEGSAVFSFQYLQNDAADASIGVQRTASGPSTQWACNQGTSVFAGLKLTFRPA
jgi:hypothetical protein